MRIRFSLLAALLALATPAVAQTPIVPITHLPSAPTYNGTEVAPIVQTVGGTPTTYKTPVGTAMQRNIGTSGSTLCLLSTACTWTGLQTYNGDLALPSLSAHGVMLGEGSSGLTAVTLTAGQLVIGQGASLDPLAKTVSGDCTISAAGAMTCTSFNGGTAFASAAGFAVGTSGPTVPLLSGANSWSGKQAFLAAALGGAGMNCGQGVTPTSPVDGDLWCTSVGVFARIGGATVQLGAAGAPGVTTFNGRAGAVTLQLSDIPPGVGTWVNALAIGVAAGNSASANTTALNAELSTLASGPGGTVFFPCGTFALQTVTIPSGPGTVNIQGNGKSCTFLQQDAADGAANFLTIGSGALHGQQDNIVSDLTLTAVTPKTGGAMIFTKGIDRPIFRHLVVLNAYNGFVENGVDRIIYEDVQIWSPVNDGYQLFDGIDCGFSPVTTTSTSPIASGSTSFTVTSSAGTAAGMNVFDASIGGNSYLGIVQGISGNTITLTSPATEASASGHTLVFGGDCGGTAVLWTKDNWVTGAGRFGVNMQGGVGGVISQGLEILGSASDAFNINTSGSHGVSNREFFFTGADSAFDGNVGSALAVTAGSASKIIGDGAWFNASTGTYAISIGLQRAQVNPPESGAIIRFTGSTIGQSNGAGLYYADQGTLTLTGNDISYNYGANSVGVLIQTNTGVGNVLIGGNMIHNNIGWGIQVVGTQPPFANYTNNDMQGSTHSISVITPGANVICTGNIGNGTTGAGC